MKKSELIEAIAKEADMTKVDATKAMEATFKVIAKALAKGKRVPVAGFGTFNISPRAAREGRNPRTGEKVHIPARNAVTFKAGTALKDQVN